jgi:hypothetical protein
MTKNFFVWMLAALSTLAAMPSSAGDDPLEGAKALYLAASYDAALSALNAPSPSADLDEVEKYRALCFLGLNRTQDAQQAIDRVVSRRPLAVVDESESPRLVAMYRDARRRLIPGVARSTYASAKDNFEHGQLTTAAAQFHDVLAILSSPDTSGDNALSDLKMLADGFLKLAEQQTAARKTPATVPPPATAVPAPAAGPEPAVARSTPGRIFAAADADVVPPITVTQVMTDWNPPVGVARVNTLAGALIVDIDERGNVFNAALATPIFAPYDRILIASTKNWKYVAAQKDGQPVRYRKVIEVVLTPTPTR